MSEQELAELDIAVAKAEGLRIDKLPPPRIKTFVSDDNGESWHIFEPTRDWNEAGRLLEKYKLTLEPSAMKASHTYWGVSAGGKFIVDGPTPQVAICKAVVALAAATATSSRGRGSGSTDESAK